MGGGAICSRCTHKVVKAVTLSKMPAGRAARLLLYRYLQWLCVRGGASSGGGGGRKHGEAAREYIVAHVPDTGVKRGLTVARLHGGTAVHLSPHVGVAVQGVDGVMGTCAPPPCNAHAAQDGELVEDARGKCRQLSMLQVPAVVGCLSGG